jgi:hypothetical protein
MIKNVQFWKKYRQTKNIVCDSKTKYRFYFAFQLENDEHQYVLPVTTNYVFSGWMPLNIRMAVGWHLIELPDESELWLKKDIIFEEVMKIMKKKLFLEELEIGVVFKKTVK